MRERLAAPGVLAHIRLSATVGPLVTDKIDTVCERLTAPRVIAHTRLIATVGPLVAG